MLCLLVLNYILVGCPCFLPLQHAHGGFRERTEGGSYAYPVDHVHFFAFLYSPIFLGWWMKEFALQAQLSLLCRGLLCRVGQLGRGKKNVRAARWEEEREINNITAFFLYPSSSVSLLLFFNSMQGWHYGKGLIYYRPIFRLTKLASLEARTRMNIEWKNEHWTISIFIV